MVKTTGLYPRLLVDTADVADSRWCECSLECLWMAEQGDDNERVHPGYGA